YVQVDNVTTGQTLLTVPVGYTITSQGAIAAGGPSPQMQNAFPLAAGRVGVGGTKATRTSAHYHQTLQCNTHPPPPEASNTTSITATATLAPYPDLQVANLAINPTSPQSSGQVTVSWNDQNTGTGAVLSSFRDYLQVDNLTTGQTLLTVPVVYDVNSSGAIPAAGMSPLRQYSFVLPDGLAGTGTLRVTVTTNYYGDIFEYSTSHAAAVANNASSITATSTLAPYPDLQVANLAISPASPQSSGLVTVSWNDRNS